MKKVITADQAPDAIGPYSHGNAFENLIFTSGQIPVNKAEGGKIPEGITAQSEQALLNLQHVLQAGGADMGTVLKTTCYLADITDFAAFNEVYKKFFFQDCPARSCFAVKDLPLGVKIEIEAIAYRK